MYSSRSNIGKVELSEGIPIRDLLNGGDVVFTVKDADIEKDVFDPGALVEDVDGLSFDDKYEIETSFEVLKEKMVDILPNGEVKKRVVRGGIGDVIPANALVRIHYEGYFEFNEVPFDSSLLRGQAFEFVIGRSGLVAGLDVGVASMRAKEKAEFLLQPSVAYGKFGCPPRIPPNAEVLFVVEVMSWKEGTEAVVAMAEANSSGEKKWKDTKAAVSALLKDGITLYNSQKYKDSKQRLLKARRLLEKTHLKDESEEEEFNKYTFKVSVNLAIVLNSLQDSASNAPAAIVALKEADRIQPNNSKVHCQWGRALITLGEFSRAKDHLLKAKRLNAEDALINQTLDELELKLKKSKEAEKQTWQRAFQIQNNKSDTENEEQLSAEAKEILSSLQEFKTNPNKDIMILPAGFSKREQEAIQSGAEKLELNFSVRGSSISISK